MTDLRIGSLCSGYGGLDMAVMDVLGGSVAWHCQYEPPDKDGREDKHQYAARILEHHWPDVPNHGDLTKVDWAKVESVDVVTFGFPCTDISYAGLGAGIKEGTRSGLWYSGVDAIRALRPRLVVLENVRAITNRRPGLDVVLADLARLGFYAEWLCLPASGIGAPHERYRWFCLARPAADAEGVGRREGRTKPAGILGGPDVAIGSSAPQTDAAGERHERGRSTRGRGSRPEDRDHAATDAAGERHGHSRQAGRRRLPATAVAGAPSDADRDAVREQPVAEHGSSSEAVAGFSGIEWGAYGPAVARWEHILGRPAPSPVDDRGRLAPPFVEWMMGLPLGHVCDVPAPPDMTDAGLRNARLKALGNGVVSQQAAYALRLLLDRAGSEVAA